MTISWSFSYNSFEKFHGKKNWGVLTLPCYIRFRLILRCVIKGLQSNHLNHTKIIWLECLSTLRRMSTIHHNKLTVKVLKFSTLVCQKGLDKQFRPRSDCWRSSLIRVFPVCYSDKHFWNSRPENQHFISDWREKVFKFLEHLPYLVLNLRHISLDELQFCAACNSLIWDKTA